MADLIFYELIHKAEKAEWNFNESFHGKGSHDRVGEFLKFNFWLLVLRGQAFVRNANEFFETAKSFTEKT